MSSPEAVFVSYRLGGADGVGVEAAKWEWALRELGFTTRRVAGEFDDALRPGDTWLAFLAIDPVPGSIPDPSALGAAIAGADVVIVENLCSLPLNTQAATTTRAVVAAHRGRVCFHHHDFAWERPHLAHVKGFPPDRPGSLHVTISEHARAALLARGIAAHCIANSFDFDAFAGDRSAARTEIGFRDDEIVLLQPTRAIPRKNVAGGLAFATEVARRLDGRPVHYWITGPAEDGFAPELDALVAHASIPVKIGRTARAHDAYAAADLVVFPSTWEGFGNPVVEAIAAQRMVAVGSYPVLDEITEGLDLLSIERPAEVVDWIDAPDADRAQRLHRNYERARSRFSIEHLPERIRTAFTAVGWTDW